ncbi:MAG: DNA alkylation repair protein [Bacteroidetes bacterium]|nr:MAG: DNA alkylation repair protein [Bacteroidota bacterium]
MTKTEVMDYLASKGSEQTRKIYQNHGCNAEVFGVKVGDMKPLQKAIKINHELALELFRTKNGDAQYFAGLIADPKKFDQPTFEEWADTSTWYMVTEYALAWNLAESDHCLSICKEWINDPSNKRQEAAWAALSAYIGITDQSDLSTEFFKELVDRVEREIDHVEGRVAYTMNGFVIAAGGGCSDLTEYCIEVGKRIGKVHVEMGSTSCKVPYIPDYIDNMKKRGRIGKKKKTAKC